VAPWQGPGRRPRKDCAEVLKDRADIHCPGKKIVLVMDNPNTRTLSTLHDRCPPAEAGRLARQFEVHHTPRHGSGLNIAAIEITVRVRPCLARRIPDRDTMVRDVTAGPTRRNADTRPVNGRFTTDDARIKLQSPYPSIQ